MKKKLLITAWIVTPLVLTAAAIIGYQDWQLRGSAPGNPASGYLRMWADTTAGKFKCLTSAGATCYFDSDTSLGALASPYGSLAQSLPPACATLTWVNQGSSTCADTNGLTLKVPNSGGNTTDSWSLLLKTLPTPPYTFTISVLYDFVASASPGGVSPALVIRDSGSGKFVALWNGFSGNSYIAVQNWNSTTSFSANALLSGIAPYPIAGMMPLFLRVADNGTNFVFSTAQDGINFHTWLTVSRTAFLASPNQIGIGGDLASSSTSTLNMFVGYWSGV